MYSYWGAQSSENTQLYVLVNGTQLQSVSDPIEYFNVYGNSFFQDNILVHANITVSDPSNEFVNAYIDHNVITMASPTYNTQVASGQTYIQSGVSRTITNWYSFESSRTDTTLFSRLDNTSFLMTNGIRTAKIFTNEMSIESTSAPIAKSSLTYGTLYLNNNNAGGSIINLDKNAISVATDVISTINSSTKDQAGTSRIFTKLESRASAVGTGNQDGTLAVFTLINGTLLETWNFNGNDNQINSFRPLDMNNNAIVTSQGNVSLSGTLSPVGHLIFSPNATVGDLIFNGTNIQSATSGGNSGQHLRIKLNGVYYKIALQLDT